MHRILVAGLVAKAALAGGEEYVLDVSLAEAPSNVVSRVIAEGQEAVLKEYDTFVEVPTDLLPNQGAMRVERVGVGVHVALLRFAMTNGTPSLSVDVTRKRVKKITPVQTGSIVEEIPEFEAKVYRFEGVLPLNAWRDMNPPAAGKKGDARAARPGDPVPRADRIRVRRK